MSHLKWKEKHKRIRCYAIKKKKKTEIQQHFWDNQPTKVKSFLPVLCVVYPAHRQNPYRNIKTTNISVTQIVCINILKFSFLFHNRRALIHSFFFLFLSLRCYIVNLAVCRTIYKRKCGVGGAKTNNFFYINVKLIFKRKTLKTEETILRVSHTYAHAQYTFLFFFLLFLLLLYRFRGIPGGYKLIMNVITVGITKKKKKMYRIVSIFICTDTHTICSRTNVQQKQREQ